MSSAGLLAPGKLWSFFDMQQAYGGTLFLIAQNLSLTVEMCKTSGKAHEVVNDTVAGMVQIVRDQLSLSNLKVSLNIADISLKMIKTEPRKIYNEFLAAQLNALKEAVSAELQTMLFFRMGDELRKYFETPNLFGDEVALKFPSASLDIEEAGKCLALARHTASVFHLMRVMEVGLRALGKELGIDYAPSWDAYIGSIQKNITAKLHDKSEEWKNSERLFKEVLGNLMTIKIAWRNPTMHIERNYTSDEAEDVLRAVRNFMQRLSERFSQV
jgi:hypothetical protein